MRKTNVLLFCHHLWRNVFALKSFRVLFVIFLLMTIYSVLSSISNFEKQNRLRMEHQMSARESWEANPDKHPHRMAHFGTFAFRMSPPLAIFDQGIENYTGSTQFLEAHRQNSVNFSEATFSTGILRFGELSLAFILHSLVPLILFFIGYACVAKDRENGTLKILLTQGARWKEILLGKTLGLFLVAQLFVFPVLLCVLVGVILILDQPMEGDHWWRLFLLWCNYLIFFFVLSALTVGVSARSKQAKTALLRLLGLWLILVVLLPKSAQALGKYWFPTPTKLAFTTAIERDEIEKGDSHNPQDPYFNQLRDSVLAAHNVEKTTDLPFNYGGFIMREGEKVSSQFYQKHYKKLVGVFLAQNSFTLYSSLVNPFTAIRLLSMSLAGTDFLAYLDFQQQSDDYRYSLSQTLNELQMALISPKKESGSEGKVHVIGQHHWEEMPDFTHKTLPLSKSLHTISFALFSLFGWGLGALGFLFHTAKKASAL